MDIKPITFLLVEDNQDHAELIQDSLEDFHIQNKVIHVPNGEEALKVLLKQPPYDNADMPLPDLVLMDIKMPKMDGVRTLEKIKAIPDISFIPVIMLTTTSEQQEVKRCFELGACSFITKPIQFEQLIQKIKDLNLYWVLTSELPNHPM